MAAARTTSRSISGSARDRLLDAALSRFDRDGALPTTLDDVRRDAGVSVGALYHHFADKRALATAVYVRALASYQAEALALLRAEPDARAGVRGLVTHHLRWSSRERTCAWFLLTQRGAVDEELVADDSRPFLAEVMGWYRQHAHYGAVRDLPFDVAYALWLGPAQEYLRHRLARPAQTIPPTAAEALADAAWNALKEPA